MQALARRHFARAGPVSGPRYVLVTQCLQNDFFLNPESRLGLPEFVVREMLVGKQHLDKKHLETKDLDRKHLGRTRRASGAGWLGARSLHEGPLGRLLSLTIDHRAKGREANGTLHVINIRDWHCPGPSYDDERRVYGRHCEKETWGAEYVDGLAHLLDPAGSPKTQKEEARYFAAGSVRIYHIHSDTLFDFKPHPTEHSGPHKFSASELEDLLDVIVQGDDRELGVLERKVMPTADKETRLERLHKLAECVARSKEEGPEDVHVAVIGVYTDIKVKTVLTGLRTRYDVSNLAVSDTFTTSPTLERHLAGLDYAKKVLGIEVVHGINDLVRFLGGSGEVKDEKSLIAAERYADYQHFFQDQQNVLAYQNQRLQEYLALTERRALKVYDLIHWANLFLIVWGAAFLLATLVLVVLKAVMPHRIAWELPLITGGLSIAQFVGVFFTTPTNDLQQNLKNLAEFKMILESHSLKTAIMRFHLTTARTLRPMANSAQARTAWHQIDTLGKQLAVIGSADVTDYAALEALRLRESDEQKPKPRKTEAEDGARGSGDGAPPPADVKDGEASRAAAR
jgi:hypothetical protein